VWRCVEVEVAVVVVGEGGQSNTMLRRTIISTHPSGALWTQVVAYPRRGGLELLEARRAETELGTIRPKEPAATSALYIQRKFHARTNLFSFSGVLLCCWQLRDSVNHCAQRPAPRPPRCSARRRWSMPIDVLSVRSHLRPCIILTVEVLVWRASVRV